MLKKILLAAGLVMAASQAHADSFSLYVGYTDNLRSSGFFPSPFCVGNGTTCQVDTADAGALDGGVFRIDNTGPTDISITNIKVTLCGGGCVFQLWNDVTVAAGTRGIFGQPTSAENFDTSDTFDFFDAPGKDIGLNGIGGCTVMGIAGNTLTSSEISACNLYAPVISFSVNGTAESFTDSGSILNTGGYDFVNNSLDGNESINWNLVGSTSTRSGDVPEPLTLGMFGAGLVGAAALRRRKSKKA